MIIKNGTMEDVKTYAQLRDLCVVLPTLEHAVHWWPRVIEMMENSQPHIIRTKTAIICRMTKTAIRLWVPYELSPTQPMDFDRPENPNFDYLCLYGLYRGRIKWL